MFFFEKKNQKTFASLDRGHVNNPCQKSFAELFYRKATVCFYAPEAEAAIRAWEADNPREKHGTGAYSSQAIGMTDDDIRQRFAAYVERFAAFV